MFRNQNFMILLILNYFGFTGGRCYDFIEEYKKIIPQGNKKNYFGNSVAVNKDYLAVGCKFDPENGMNAGAVYIYKYINDDWIYDVKLLPSNGSGYEEFGYAVAFFGNVLVVGSRRDNINGHDSGSVYLFENNHGSWMESHQLTPSDGRNGGRFGQHVAISGNTIVVNCNYGSSLAYVFEKIGDKWFEKDKLKISEPLIEHYDHPVAIFRDRIVVGRYYDNAKGHQSGSAVVFKRISGKWKEEAKLLPSDGYFANWFGVSVAISDKFVVVSSHGDDVKGDESGSAYVFEYDGINWIERTKLTPKLGKAGDSFGYPVSIHNDKIAVGCMGDDSAGPGHNSGAVHIYKNIEGNWTEQYKLLPSDGEYNGRFGFSIDMNDEYTTVGSIKFNIFDKSGFVYIYKNIDVANNTDLFCEEDIPIDTMNHFVWILAVSIPLSLIFCCVLFVCICKRVRAPKIEKGEDQAEFIYHDVTKSEAAVA